MWRAGLVGILVMGASCGKKTDEGPEVVAGAPAGAVIELEGKVTANGKPLAKGDAVAGDDLVETAEGARVAIELAHNHARWTLTGDKHERPRDSKAWRMAKVLGSAAGVDQTATSAGRDGERRAAETDVTTTAAGSAAPPAQVELERRPVMRAPADTAAPGGPPSKVAGDKPAAPPPPLAKPRSLAPSRADADDDAKKKDDEDMVMAPAPHTHQILAHDAELAKCVKPGATAHLVVTCTEKSCVLATTGPATACLRARFGKLVVPKAVYTVELDLTGPAR